MTVRESAIERKHRVIAMSWGWFITKILRASPNGFPDRLYARAWPKDVCRTCNRGRIVLIEFKRPGGPVRKQQKLRHDQLRQAGVEVHVVESVAEANRVLGISDEVAEDL